MNDAAHTSESTSSNADSVADSVADANGHSASSHDSRRMQNKYEPYVMFVIIVGIMLCQAVFAPYSGNG